jgi:hypothetical protein
MEEQKDIETNPTTPRPHAPQISLNTPIVGTWNSPVLIVSFESRNLSLNMLSRCALVSTSATAICSLLIIAIRG